MPIKSDVRKVLAKIASDLERGAYDNEQQVIQSSIMCILNALGWDTYAPDELRREYRVDTGKVDIALRNNAGSLIFIEAKAVGKIDNDSEEQAFKYAAGEGVPLLILTDGCEWNFYLPLSLGKRPDRQFYKLHISKEESTINECVEVFCSYLSREEVTSGNAREKATKLLQEKKANNDKKTEESVLRSMPQMWGKLLGESSELREMLEKEIERKYHFRPSSDMVDEFLSSYAKERHVSDVPEKSADENDAATPSNTSLYEENHNNDPLLNSKIKITGISFDGEKYPVTSGRRVLVRALELFSEKDVSFLEEFKQKSMTSRGVARVSKDPNELFPDGYTNSNAGRCEQLAVLGEWWVYGNLSKPDCRALVIIACEIMKITYGKDFKILT